MAYKVSLQSGSNKTVRLSSTGGILGTSGGGNFTIKLAGGGAGGGVARNLSELGDISTDGAQNRWVLVFDQPSGTFKFVNPDEVVDAAVGSSTVPGGAPTGTGLSSDTIEYLDDVLDDRVDLDGGTF